jgi:hypothetical protein
MKIRILCLSMVASSLVHAQQLEQLFSDSSFSGKPMQVNRIREQGLLSEVVARWRTNWERLGVTRETRNGEWMILSRPSQTGFEVLQFRQSGAFVEAYSSQVAYDAAQKAKIASARSARSSLLDALGLESVAPPMDQRDGNQTTKVRIAQLPGVLSIVYERLTQQILAAGWRSDFSHLDAPRGAVFMLRDPAGRRANATLQSHQGGVALVVIESAESGL